MRINTDLGKDELIELIKYNYAKMNGKIFPTLNGKIIAENGDLDISALNKASTLDVFQYFLKCKCEYKVHYKFSYKSLNIIGAKFGNSTTYELLSENPPVIGCYYKLSIENIKDLYEYSHNAKDKVLASPIEFYLPKNLTLDELLSYQEIWLFHDIACLSGWAGLYIIDKQGEVKNIIAIRS